MYSVQINRYIYIGISDGGEFCVKGRYICMCLRVGGGAQQCGRDILGGGGALENLKDNLIH